MVLRIHYFIYSAGGDFTPSSFSDPITVNTYIHGGINADLTVRDRMIQMIIYVTILQIGILLIETTLRFYFSFITAWLGQTVVKDLRIAVYKRVLTLNLSQYDKTPIGTLTTRTINDIEAINDIFSEGLIPIVSDLLSIISILLLCFCPTGSSP